GGFSLGAAMASQFAALLGKRVQGLLLVSPGGLGDARTARPRTRRLSSKSGPAGQRAVHRHNLGTIMFGRPANIDELAVHVQQNNVNRARLRTRLMPQPDFLLSALRQVEAPLTGIWGARDAFSPF